MWKADYEINFLVLQNPARKELGHKHAKNKDEHTYHTVRLAVTSHNVQVQQPVAERAEAKKAKQ